MQNNKPITHIGAQNQNVSLGPRASIVLRNERQMPQPSEVRAQMLRRLQDRGNPFDASRFLSLRWGSLAMFEGCLRSLDAGAFIIRTSVLKYQFDVG